MTTKPPWIAPELAPVVAQLDDAQVCIVTLYGEARSESLDGIVAVGNVVRNRVADGRWGSTYRAVCLAPWQFSCWNPAGGSRNYDRVATLVRSLAAGEASDPVVRELTYLAHGLIRPGWLRDNVQGATHYHTATLTPRPAWARTVAPVVQRGSHVFYAGVT
jgi:spore germination cell wall hydrolase CwlJ-like protein